MPVELGNVQLAQFAHFVERVLLLWGDWFNMCTFYGLNIFYLLQVFCQVFLFGCLQCDGQCGGHCSPPLTLLWLFVCPSPPAPTSFRLIFTWCHLICCLMFLFSQFPAILSCGYLSALLLLLPHPFHLIFTWCHPICCFQFLILFSQFPAILSCGYLSALFLLLPHPLSPDFALIPPDLLSHVS